MPTPAPAPSMIRDVVATLPFPSAGAVVVIERTRAAQRQGAPAQYVLALFSGDKVVERRYTPEEARLMDMADAMVYEYDRRTTALAAAGAAPQSLPVLAA